MSWYRYDEAGNLTLFLHVQAGAKRTQIAGIHNERLKISLAAPALEGKANACLLAFLAELFNVRQNQVLLKQGEKGRSKTIMIHSPQHHPDSLL